MGRRVVEGRKQEETEKSSKRSALALEWAVGTRKGKAALPSARVRTPQRKSVIDGGWRLGWMADGQQDSALTHFGDSMGSGPRTTWPVLPILTPPPFVASNKESRKSHPPPSISIGRSVT